MAAEKRGDDAGASKSQQGLIRPDRLNLYRLAYEESTRALEDQKAELDAIRQRTMQFLAFIGTATAFLVGAGVRAPERDNVFYLVAALGTVFTLATLGLAGTVLLSWRRGFPKPRLDEWAFRSSAERLIQWIEPDVGSPSEVDFLRSLALHNDGMSQGNELHLKSLRRLYVCFLFVAFGQLITWTALVWARG